MRHLKYIYIGFFCVMLFATACVKDLELEPIDPQVDIPQNVFKSENDYKMALAKIYASYAVSGQSADEVDADIRGIDINFGNYVRQLWGLQELSTDESIMAWDDQTIKSFHWHTWGSNDSFIQALYYRIYYAIAIANEFIRVTNDAIPDGDATLAASLQAMQAEARFLRALSYYHAIDMFGNVPFVDEEDLPGNFNPPRITRSELFTWLETELTELIPLLMAPGTNEYARADRAAGWMLLAKLYLNAEVYTGTAHYDDAVTYINLIINSGAYQLDNNYQDIFLADNNYSPEIIFPITFDGQNTTQYGGMTFLLSASKGGGMPLNGSDGAWGGIRAIEELVALFGLGESDFSPASPETRSADTRGMFYFNTDNGWEWEITNVGTFTQGVGVTKFKNLDTLGNGGADLPTGHATFVSTDYPMFRLGDVYLMYAECAVRGASGANMATAVSYINDLRYRAYSNSNAGDILQSQLTLDFILDERARELYWEGHRRTDLIRFGQFTDGDYHWTWKGNVQEGKATEAYRDLYPIPAADINANSNLRQNDGYN